VSNAPREEFGIPVPLPGSGKASIRPRLVHHTEKTLSAMTSLDRNSKAAINMIKEKAHKWINDVRNGHLHRRNVWFLLKVQLWPQIGYGLCSFTASFQELSKALH
jgi:hypothetical protein